MPSIKKRRVNKPNKLAATMLRAFRFESKLFERFETDCKRHLRNPRAVLEALIHHWLSTNARQRDTIASQYQRLERVEERRE